MRYHDLGSFEREKHSPVIVPEAIKEFEARSSVRVFPKNYIDVPGHFKKNPVTLSNIKKIHENFRQW
jgi:hypothetical protein